VKLTISCLALTLVVALAPDAQGRSQDWGGLEDDWSMPTGTNYSGPVAITCKAAGANNQRCRACRKQYLDSGQETGYFVCAFVPINAACSCELSNGGRSCGEKGSCTYY
jgi:hypothetical protein